MGTLYFTRHGETIWNVENKICGATDIALTERGHQQAAELGEKIRAAVAKGDMHIDEILYSPLCRAADTARRISEVTGIPMRAEKRLTEQNFGRFESTARDGAEFHEAKKEFICSYDGGESMLRVAQRVYNLLDDIIAEPDKVCLLVAHHGISRIVESYFRDMTSEEFSSFSLENCEVLTYHF